MKLSFRTAILSAFIAANTGSATDCATKLIIFGDSLSDTGNLLTATAGAQPISPPYETGRFTNGLVWAEHLADLMGLDPILPSTSGGTNYAYAGASSGSDTSSTWTPMLHGIVTTLPALGIRGQVDTFVADVAAGAHGTLCADSPVLLWGGAADMVVLGRAPDYPTILTELEGSLKELKNGAGMTNLIVLNVPPLFASPAANGVPSLFVPSTLEDDNLAENIIAYNAALIPLLEAIGSARMAAKITHVDTFSIIGGLADDLAANGINLNFGVPVINESALYLQGDVDYTNEVNAFWFDGVHPTALVHEIIAGGFYEAITAKSSKSAKGAKAGKAAKSSKMPKGEKAAKAGKADKAAKADKATR